MDFFFSNAFFLCATLSTPAILFLFINMKLNKNYFSLIIITLEWKFLTLISNFFFFFYKKYLGRGLLEEEVHQEVKEESLENKQEQYYWHQFVVTQRRLAVGPGSSPPTCRARCGRCDPCRPVHVAIQPGLSRPLEYYPEAWRCKCGNKLFMPWL